ncbi:MAG TPA: NAD-dependent epimerase/dehydratase family protein [Phototrophicaceae bacterium]|nr:NAD-dependent epimerase/dehydratase family protein [Phototrophicaceae bacterium]
MDNALDLQIWRGQPVLVTGGTGFVGRHVVALGLRQQLDLHVPTSRNLPLPGAKTYAVDLSDKAQVVALIEQVQPKAILHLAAAGVTYGAASLEQMLRVNVLGLQSLLEAAAALPAPPTVVIAGSGAEYAPQNRFLQEDDPTLPASAYGVSKAAAFPIAQYYAQKLPITWLRLFNIYGPGEAYPRLAPYIVQQSLRGEAIELTAGEQIRDYVHVDDVAEAIWRTAALAHRADGIQVINVGSGQPLPLKVFVQTLVAALREHGIDAPVQLGVKPYRPDEPMFYAADINRMSALLDWTPTISLETGLQATVEAMLEQAR